MRLLGFQIPNFTYPGVPNDRLFEQIVTLATAAERGGFDCVYVMDHLYYTPRVRPHAVPVLDGYPLLTGGGGEQRTLTLVAQYGDMCNFFGDVAPVRHKLDVLQRHCEAVGRDPNTISKTRLGSLIIRGTDAEAERALERRMKVPGVNPEWVRFGYIVGGPERVSEQVQKFLDVGLDGMIFNMPHVEDPQAIELAGKTLARLG